MDVLFEDVGEHGGFINTAGDCGEYCLINAWGYETLSLRTVFVGVCWCFE